MGESRRRRRADLGPNGKFVMPDAPELRALLAEGSPINVSLLGSAAILREVATHTAEEMMTPERQPLRYAFTTLDRIRTGEIDPWTCILCGRDFRGLRELSVMAVIQRTLGAPVANKPAAISPICHSCDSVSEETQRKVQRMFGLMPLQTGTA
jgi:hypothetical protein